MPVYPGASRRPLGTSQRKERRSRRRYVSGTAAPSSAAMRDAHPRISSQVAQVAVLRRRVLDHRALRRPVRVRRHATAEYHVLADSERLRPLDDPWWLLPRRLVAAQVADRPGTEHPERPLRQLLAVLAQEMLGIATPALHVHRAAEHHGVVGLNVADLAGIDAINGRPSPRSVSQTASAISAVDPCLDAYATRTFVTHQRSRSAEPASSVVAPRTGPANCGPLWSSRQAHRRARLTVTAPTTIPATRQGLNQMDDPPASGHPLFGRLHPRRCGSIDIAAEIEEEHHYARLECRHALSAPRAAVTRPAVSCGWVVAQAMGEPEYPARWAARPHPNRRAAVLTTSAPAIEMDGGCCSKPRESHCDSDGGMRKP